MTLEEKYKTLLQFVVKIYYGFNLNEDDEKSLLKLASYEIGARRLLKKIGELQDDSA